MVADDDVTVGEVYRAVLEIRKDLRENNKNYVPLTLYNSERDAFRDDLKSLGQEVANLRTSLELERDARIKAEQTREKADLQQEQQRSKAASERRLQWTLVIVGPIVSAMISIVAAATSMGLHIGP